MITETIKMENVFGDVVTVSEVDDGSAILDYKDENGNERRKYFICFEGAYNSAYLWGYRE